MPFHFLHELEVSSKQGHQGSSLCWNWTLYKRRKRRQRLPLLDWPSHLQLWGRQSETGEGWERMPGFASQLPPVDCCCPRSTHMHTHTCTHTHAHTHTCMHAHTHTSHTRMHAHTHTHARTHTHTHTHTHRNDKHIYILHPPPPRD